MGRKRKMEPVSAGDVIVEPAVDLETGANQHTESRETLQRPPKFDMRPEDFFRYWAAIPPTVRDGRILVYVYRLMPLCDVLQPLSEEQIREINRNHRKRPATNIAKLTEPLNPDDWVHDICSKWGAGEYHFKLNDFHPSVKKTICMTATKGEGSLRDYDSYPPVLNLAEVIMTEPKNQPYIRWCRLNKIRLPGDPDFKANATTSEETGESEDTEEMQIQSQALVNAVDKLVDSNTGLAKEVAAGRNSQPAPTQSLDGVAGEKILETMAQANLKSQEIITGAVREAQAINGKLGDPIAMFAAFGETMKGIFSTFAPAKSDGDGGAMVQVLMKQMELQASSFQADRQQAHERHMAELKAAEERSKMEREFLTTQITALRDELKVARTEKKEEKGILGSIKELGAVREGLEMLGIGGGGVMDDVPWWGRGLLKLAETLPPNLANAAYNIAAMRTGGPAQPPPVISEEVEEGEEEQQSGGFALPGVNQRQPQGDPEAAMIERIKGMLKALRQPLTQALARGMGGHEFGAWMVLQGGEADYNQLCSFGRASIETFISQYDGGLWGEIGKRGAQWNVFIEQFLNVEMVRQAISELQKQQLNAQRQQQQQQRPAGPATAGRSVMDPATGRPIKTQAPNGPPAPTVVETTATPPESGS